MKTVYIKVPENQTIINLDPAVTEKNWNEYSEWFFFYFIFSSQTWCRIAWHLEIKS